MSARRAGLKRKAAEQAEVKAKRAKGETDLSDSLKWDYHGEVVKNVCPLLTLTSPTLPGSQKAAGFDIDFTVIKTASGRKFATGASDWEWWDESVPDKLRELHKDGYRVIFFTNQAGIEKLKVQPEELQRKIEAIIKELDIPVLAFVCTGENHYRKPSTLMWEYWETKCNQGVKVDRTKCLYVGDAAGRAKEWAPGKPKDFSCSDRKFAANLGVKFQTPEEFFLGEDPAKFAWQSVDPNTVLKKTDVASKEYHSKSPEMVIMVGAPATGKSTFRKRYFEPHGYIAVNRDTMGTMQKCVKAATEALKTGKSVVADNTNPTQAARKEFIDCAKKSGVPCRCFVMDTPIDLAHHLNYVRQNQTKGGVRRIPDVGYNVYKKNFEAPSKAEGFTEIIQIPFVPKFDSKKDEEIFKQWT
ncbi:bifunctional polynucleotide phosphatase/kinase-like [Ruditapes philippinarum]|uniref:bifunctional polynucleotide phosphatase/kinase-like n=1 Tax=Ruditapes philippinarum TaxID=129788 RepID=UPI00295A7BCB|nr:bifunctional polynucleotide phosphatase/kinase-like [Ruditapes philippinarum]